MSATSAMIALQWYRASEYSLTASRSMMLINCQGMHLPILREQHNTQKRQQIADAEQNKQTRRVSFECNGQNKTPLLTTRLGMMRSLSGGVNGSLIPLHKQNRWCSVLQTSQARAVSQLGQLHWKRACESGETSTESTASAQGPRCSGCTVSKAQSLCPAA